MISELRELYQEVIVDHSKRPRNFRLLQQPTNHAEGFNPLCGDRIALQIAVDDGVIKDAAFQGSGCAISTASASLMTETLKGKSVAQAEQLFGQFHQLITGETGVPRDLGKLAALSGVRDFPARVKCATLAWHTLRLLQRDLNISAVPRPHVCADRVLDASLQVMKHRLTSVAWRPRARHESDN